MYNRYRAFFAAYKRAQASGNPLTKEEIVFEFTNGQTESLKELSDDELRELTIQLSRQSVKPDTAAPTTFGANKTEKGDKMRKAIIAIFLSMNRTVKEAIAWSEKQGVKGQKKRFNDYTNQELYQLIMIAEKIRADRDRAVRKGIK